MTTFQFKQLINGRWVDAVDGTTWDLINPATEQVIQQVPFGGQADAQQAVDAAYDAFQTWSKTTPYERADILLNAVDWILEHAEALGKITTEESGKPLVEATIEWRSATNYIKWFAEECKRSYGRIIPARVATRRIHVQQQPLGVVGTITAWNFPIYNLVRSWAAALASGCTVVGRPSEFTPRSGMLLAQAFQEGGLPAGVLNLINGDPEAMAQVMLNDSRVRKISFTGSTRVGKLLMDGASKTITHLALELGGNAPILIFPDTDLETVAKLSVDWKYRNCGQVCVSPQQFFVHSQVVEEFTERVEALSKQIVIGNGLDSATQLGHLINDTQRNRVEYLVQDAVGSGATLIAGGRRPSQFNVGYFFQPTVITNLDPNMPLYHEEIFGPVLPIIPFDNPQEALAMANDTDYGLAAFVQTNDLNTALRISEQLEYGMVCINDWLPATPEAPFGGVKQSGIGRECGLEGLEHYMETKTVFFGGVQ